MSETRPGNEPLVRLRNVDRAYDQGGGKVFVLRRITLDIAQGEFVSIMGPSGAGKSTVLHVLGMHDAAFTGEYEFLGYKVHALGRKERQELQKKHIGFVFQSYHLLDDLTVYENLEVPLSYRDVKRSERQAIVADVVEALRLLLKPEGYEIATAASPRAVLETVQAREFDLVLMDLNYARDTTSGAEGLDLLTRLREIDPTLPVVVMTAWASLDLAVEAMRRGARDFVAKPWDNARLLAIVRTQVELGSALRRGRRLEAENRLLRGDGTGAPRPLLIAESTAMQPVLEMIDRVGPSDAAVLITGDNGSGKGTVAQALHAVSARAARPLVTVNAGGLSEGVFESELFGHVKGAFTDARADRVGGFELADGSTLFLDEIANVPRNLQAKHLCFLETGDLERVGSSATRRVNVRVPAATDGDVKAEAAAGRFRQDLLFRLNTIEIHVPPLRERREDVPLLAAHFLSTHAQRYRK